MYLPEDAPVLLIGTEFREHRNMEAILLTKSAVLMKIEPHMEMEAARALQVRLLPETRRVPEEEGLMSRPLTETRQLEEALLTEMEHLPESMGKKR